MFCELCVCPFLHLSYLADALIQSDLREQVGLSALLEHIDRFFSPSLLREDVLLFILNIYCKNKVLSHPEEGTVMPKCL
jgi:hypothetical protein